MGLSEEIVHQQDVNQVTVNPTSFSQSQTLYAVIDKTFYVDIWPLKLQH